MLNVSHYDRPVSHSQTQTRWIIPAGRKVFAASIKVLDLKINPDVDCHFAPLVGGYGCIKRLQIRCANKEIDQWYSQTALPFLLSLPDNQAQKGIQSQLLGTGNNLTYDTRSKLLKLERAIVDEQTVQLPLYVLSNWLSEVGFVDEPLEIIVSWDTANLSKWLVPVEDGTLVSSVSIDPPFLSYETVNYPSAEQRKNFVFKKLIQDEWSIPQTTDNTTTETLFRCNAFADKVLMRLMLTNLPQSVYTADPNADNEQLFRTFGFYQSTPMNKETFNLNVNGENIINFIYPMHDAVKLSLASQAFGNAHFATAGHVHTVKSALKELQGTDILNGFANYGALEINQKIRKDLVFTHRRTSKTQATYPTLQEQLIVAAVGEVACVYKGMGVVEYL
jgi:hypothetical protein